MGHQSYPSIRREVFGRIGLFDETMVRNQDIELTAAGAGRGISHRDLAEVEVPLFSATDVATFGPKDVRKRFVGRAVP